VFFPDLKIEWDCKEHDKSISMPEDWKSKTLHKIVKDKSDEIIKESSDDLFVTMSKGFEKSHTKIINDSVFVKKIDDKVIIMSEKQLITSYKHMQCGVNSNNNPVSFIQKWTNCNDCIQKKDSMQIYPNPDKCPSNVFNIWCPFAMETLTEPYESYIEGFGIMKNHIRILCNNEEPVYDYFIA
jgi:hypothetical protein